MRSFIIQLLLIGASLFFVQSANAQCSRGKATQYSWQLRMATGLTPTFVKDHTSTTIPQLSLELRYRPNPKFSLGLLAGASVSNVIQHHHTGVSQHLENEFRMVALRAGIHTQRWEKWETYGGILLAYQHNRVTSQDGDKANTASAIHYTPQQQGFFYSAFLGSAFKPVPQIELFGELSYGLSILTVGAGFSW